MEPQLYFEDFKIGDEFDIPSKTLTDAHNIMFAGISGDNHPIHYDLEFCKARGHPEKLVHGLLTVTQTCPGASTLAPKMDEAIIAFLEQSSKFLGPVYVGDTLYPKLTVKELTPSKKTGVVRLRSTIRNHRGQLVMEGEQLLLFKKRAAGA